MNAETKPSLTPILDSIQPKGGPSMGCSPDTGFTPLTGKNLTGGFR